MDILEGLNPEQRAAAEHTDGPMLVVAGAGTGKTQVITRRIAYLIAQGHAKPSEVLALTFTEKAAREMEERLYDLIGWQSFQVPIMTFHAFGAELMVRFASHVGRSVRGGLLNDTQKTLLLQQHYGRVSLEYYGRQGHLFDFLEGIVAYIGQLQNEEVSVGDYEKYVARLEADPGDRHPQDVAEQRDLAKLYRLYETVKEETGTFDFSDQLYVPLKVLRERENLARRLAAEYKYVLVDEYQDTNAVQDALLRCFIGPDGNLFAVGDDDQSIYGFRGAEIGNILSFAEHFQISKAAVLVRNYRSGQSILDAAYQLIRHNDPERLEAKLGIDKRLMAEKAESQVEFVRYRKSTDEQEGVLEAVAARLTAGEPAAEIAVLAATHMPLKAMAKVMRRRGIPFALSTAVSIFQQPEILGLWYLLRWLAMEADEESVAHVMMGPYIGWTADQCRRLTETARESLVTAEEALAQDQSEAARELVARLELWRGWAKELPVSLVAYKLVFETGLAEQWQTKALDSPRMLRVFEDLNRLLEHMQDYETVEIDTTVSGYMRTFPKPPTLEVREPQGDADGVQLLTVHSAKGLEFDTVYLIGCTQRMWSGGRSAGRQVPDELRRRVELPPEHEFRRLMYVAATRARKELVVSAATQTAGGSKQAVSPFVEEMMGEAPEAKIVAAVSEDRLGQALSKLQRFYPMRDEGIIKLPFESADGWLDLGVTQLDRYDYCPFEFFTESVLKLRQPMGPQVAFGQVLHSAFEGYYKARMTGTERPAQELHDLLDELWVERGYETRELAEADRSLAHNTLEAFLVREGVEQRRVLGSEVKVRFELPEAKLRLRGKIDAYFEVDGGVQLRDFKTGRGKTDAEALAKKAKDSLQLRSYALAYETLNGQAPAEVVLDYIVTGVEGVARLTPRVLQNHRQKLAEIAERIRARDFAPKVSPMHPTCAAMTYYGTGEADELMEAALEREAEEIS